MKIFGDIVELLTNGEPFVLATVATCSGSAPRHVGSRMIVRGDGTIRGTIGGGVLEARVIEAARGVFQDKSPLLREFVLTADDAGQLGMICGGTLEVLMNRLDPDDSTQLRLYETLAATVRGQKRAWLVTRIPGQGSEREGLEQVLVRSDGSMDGGEGLVPENIQDVMRHRGGGRSSIVDSEGRRFVVEDLCDQGTVFIFGAGHVGLALAQVNGFVGFKTVVLDDRKEFANRDRFPAVEEIVLLVSFPTAFESLRIDSDSYIVIVTRGHIHDKTVLRQALKTGAGYIGMIGSRKKRDATFEALMQEGFSREDLARVYAPIGLAIGAETPEEIAVCILGELIQVRAEKNR